MKKFDSINVIPFIDIMLVLLAIVLTTATFVSNGQLEINLPASSSAAALQDNDPIEVALDEQLNYFVDGEPKTLEQLKGVLSALPKDSPIVLRIDEMVAFKDVVSTIDILNSLSLQQVSVVTRVQP